MKKTISVILSLVLALSCLMAITPMSAMAEDAVATAAATENLITNPGFEDDLTGWSGSTKVGSSWYNAEMSVVTDVAHSGTKSLHRVNSTSENQSGHLFHQILNLEANTVYELTFWVKGNTGWGRFYLSGNVSDPDDRDTSIIFTKNFADMGAYICDDWTKLSVKFTTTEATSYILVFRSITPETDFWLDDFSLIKDTNVVVNPGFEDDFDGWTKYQYDASYPVQADITSAEKNSGNKSVNYYNRTSGSLGSRALGQALVLEPNSRYKISFYLKGNPQWGSVVVDGAMKYPWSMDDLHFRKQWSGQEYTEWTKFTDYFVTDENSNYILAICLTGANTEAYLDDFCIEKCESIVANGGFEEGKIGWTWYKHSTSYNDAFAEVTEDISHDGDYALHYSPVDDVRYDNRCIMQNIVLEANTDYKISFWTMGNPHYGKVMIHSNTEKPWEDTDPVFSKQFDDTTPEDWVKVTYYFTTDERTNYILAFAFAHENVNLLIDDVVIEKRNDGIIVNPGFEDGMAGWSTNVSMNAAATMDDSNSGDFSLCRSLDTKVYNQVVYQKIVLEPNQKYRLSYYMKGTSDYLRTAVATDVKSTYSNENCVLWDDSVTSYTNEDWTKRTFYFTTNDNTEYYLGLYHFMAGTAYFDDFAIEKYDNILLNGDFEDGMNNWSKWWDPQCDIIPEGRNESNALLQYVDIEGEETNTALRKYGRVVYQDVEVEAYSEYTISMWVKGHTGWGRFYVWDTANDPKVQANDLALDGAYLNYQWATEDKTEYADWTQISCTFTTEEATSIRIGFYFTHPATELLIDDVVLKATGVKVGDFDGTGKADAEDAASMKKFILGADSGLEDTSILDITGDTAINILDLIRIKKILAAIA